MGVCRLRSKSDIKPTETSSVEQCNLVVLSGRGSLTFNAINPSVRCNEYDVPIPNHTCIELSVSVGAAESQGQEVVAPLKDELYAFRRGKHSWVKHSVIQG
jgi:hypothetical protein